MEQHESGPVGGRAISPPYLAAGAERESEVVRALLRETAVQEAADVVAHFYDVLTADADAAAFLSHEVVQARLTPSLQAWLISLMSAEDGAAGEVDKQHVIGAIHARIRLPAHLMLQGAMVLKARFGAALSRRSPDAETCAEALAAMHARIDGAMCEMISAYVSGNADRAQAFEAFRLFAAGPESALDRETQRAALMEWMQGVLYALLGGDDDPPLQPIRTAPFGLWVTHRAGVIFQGLPGLDALGKALVQIDSLILPQLSAARQVGGSRVSAVAGQLRTVVDEVRFLLDDLFQVVVSNQEGRDPLTRTLNRRFLPAVLGREAAIARRDDLPFAVLMLDIDHFKAINDRWGHTAGDAVLRDVAELLLDGVRLSDFVFRYGGEEFLLVLPEADEDAAREAAERLLATLRITPLRLPDGSSTNVTASAGLALFDGHPDYATLIERADAALYDAKRAGRDRLAIAPPLAPQPQA